MTAPAPTAFHLAAAAYRAGYATARNRRPRVNPHDGTAVSAVERVQSVMWARGYSRGNPMPRTF